MKQITTVILTGASVIGLQAHVPVAMAQTTENASQAGISEIVVTAQKRSESVQKTPLAVTAIGSATITQKGLFSLFAVQGQIPSARIQQQGAVTEVFMRGVGSTVDAPNTEPPVGFHFEGVYIPREGTSTPLFDIARIEALPGPQGTLYGRSSIGGVINVAFNRPTQTLESKGLLEVGNYSLVHASAVQNVPLSADLAARLAVDYTYRGGYNTSGADSQNDVAVRLSGLYQPTKDFSLYLWGYGVSRNGHPAAVVNKGQDKNGNLDNNAFLHNDPWNDTYTGALATFAVFGQPKKEDQHYRHYATGAELRWDVGDDTTLTYVPSYIYLDQKQDYWISALPARVTMQYNQVTQELRLNGKAGRLKWLVGLYGYNVVNSGTLDIALASQLAVDRQRLRGIAGFGELTYGLFDGFDLTVGGRYSLDNRTARGRAPDATGAPTVPYRYDQDFKRFDYRILAQYQATPNSMLYAGVQTGYQPGTYNARPSTPTFDNKVKEARLTSYTAGIKNRLLDGKLQLNNELFYYDYRDLFIQTFNASGFTQIFNAKRVEIYGNQLDLILKPSLNDELNLSVGYLHARNKEFVTPLGENLNGLALSFAPTWTVNAGYQHDFQLSSGYLRARGDVRSESSFWGDFHHGPGTRQEAYAKFDASLTYYDGGSRWSLGAWIKNIGNVPVEAAAAAGGLPGPAATYLEPPRTFGLRATISM